MDEKESKKPLPITAIAVLACAWLVILFGLFTFMMRTVNGMVPAEYERSFHEIIVQVESYSIEYGSLPPTTPLTPNQSCCPSKSSPEDFPLCEPTVYGHEQWEHPAWQALGFRQERSHAYRYQFISNESSFTVRAVGDLDCDGEMVTFEYQGTLVEESHHLELSKLQRHPEPTGPRALIDRWFGRTPLE